MVIFPSHRPRQWKGLNVHTLTDAYRGFQISSNTDYLKDLCKSYAYTMEAYGNIRILFEKDYLSLYLSLNTEYPKETLLIHYGGLQKPNENLMEAY